MYAKQKRQMKATAMMTVHIPMMALSFLRLSRMRVSICALTVSSARPCVYITQSTGGIGSRRADTYLLSLAQLLNCAVHAFLQDGDLLVLLLADAFNIRFGVVEFDQQIVDLYLLRLEPSC